MSDSFQSNLHVHGDDFGGEVNPQTAKVLRELSGQGDPEASLDDIILGARTGNILEPFEMKCEFELDVREEKLSHSGREVRVRAYRPKGLGGALPVLQFIHGGCWVFCSIDSHDQLCRNYAHALQCVVVSVDYGLAPEKQFPHGLMDCVAVYQALREGQLDGVDTDVIMVAGDSAGGNLSATLCGYLKDKGERQPEAQVLLYPITDISNMDRTCHRRYADDYFFTLETLQWTSTSYVSEDSKRRDPWVSPLYSVNLQGLAPAHVVLAECDVLVGEGMAYAEKLHESGVNVECHLYRGVVHAFMAMAGSVDLGKVAFDGSVEFMKRYF